jgi:hypothetical protein
MNVPGTVASERHRHSTSVGRSWQGDIPLSSYRDKPYMANHTLIQLTILGQKCSTVRRMQQPLLRFESIHHEVTFLNITAKIQLRLKSSRNRSGDHRCTHMQDTFFCRSFPPPRMPLFSRDRPCPKGIPNQNKPSYRSSIPESSQIPSKWLRSPEMPSFRKW